MWQARWPHITNMHVQLYTHNSPSSSVNQKNVRSANSIFKIFSPLLWLFRKADPPKMPAAPAFWNHPDFRSIHPAAAYFWTSLQVTIIIRTSTTATTTKSALHTLTGRQQEQLRSGCAMQCWGGKKKKHKCPAGITWV